MPLTFHQAQFIVATSAGVDQEKLGSLESRMKQWQKMGFPSGIRGVGKGARAQYGASQMFKLLIMMQLLKLGLTPSLAKNIIEERWGQFRNGIVHALISQANADGERHYFVIQLDALSELTNPGTEHMPFYIEILSNADIKYAWDVPDHEASEADDELSFYASWAARNRLVNAFVIEIDSLIYWLWLCLREMKISPVIFAEEFEQWHGNLHEHRTPELRDLEILMRVTNMSAFEYDVGKVDVEALSREALSLISDKFRNG